MYRIALSRDPTEKELEGNLAFLKKQRQGDSDEMGALTDLADVMLNTNEFLYMN